MNTILKYHGLLCVLRNVQALEFEDFEIHPRAYSHVREKCWMRPQKIRTSILAPLHLSHSFLCIIALTSTPKFLLCSLQRHDAMYSVVYIGILIVHVPVHNINIIRTLYGLQMLKCSNLITSRPLKFTVLFTLHYTAFHFTLSHLFTIYLSPSLGLFLK